MNLNFAYCIHIHIVFTIFIGEYEYILNISEYIQDLTFGEKLGHNLGESILELCGHSCGTIQGSGSFLLVRDGPKSWTHFGSQKLDLGKSKGEQIRYGTIPAWQFPGGSDHWFWGLLMTFELQGVLSWHPTWQIWVEKQQLHHIQIYLNMPWPYHIIFIFYLHLPQRIIFICIWIYSKYIFRIVFMASTKPKSQEKARSKCQIADALLADSSATSESG